MNKWLFSLVTTFALSNFAAAELTYELVPDFIKPPAGKETIGNGHGEITVDSTGKIYVSVDNQADGGIQVYSQDGKFIESLKGAPGSMHGFVIHKDAGGEFIYGAVLGQQRVVKLKLDGTQVLEIPKSAFPADKAGALKLTSVAVGPNGDIYVVDGYGADWIFLFDKAGTFKKVFGGRVDPYKLSNCHKIFIDPRFSPVRLLLCDRGNNRILHLSLNGDILGTIVDKGLRRPSSASFNGDLVCIAEIEGRISVWDKEGKMVAALGVNDTNGQTNTPDVKPADWRTGIVTSPHGITFDARGNIMETEWNNFGRILRWNRK